MQQQKEPGNKVSMDMVWRQKSFADVSYDATTQSVVWYERREGTSKIVAVGPDHRAEFAFGEQIGGQLDYGGGGMTVGNGKVVYIERKKGQLKLLDLRTGGTTVVLDQFGPMASPQLSPDGQWVVFLHRDAATEQDRIGIVDAAGENWPVCLIKGHDFYSQPRFSPDGKHFSFITWSDKAMPWEHSELFHGKLDLADKRLPVVRDLKRVSDFNHCSFFQPEFDHQGEALYFICDQSGYQELYRYFLHEGSIEQVTNGRQDLGFPHWVRGMRSYSLTADDDLAYVVANDGFAARLHRCQLSSGELSVVTDLADIQDVSHVGPSSGEEVCLMGSGPRQPPQVLRLTAGGSKYRLSRAFDERLAPELLTEPERLQWDNLDGSTAYGLYYPPTGGLGQEPPPMLMLIHSGPTSQSNCRWPDKARYFCRLGYGVFYLNFRGSSGFGREYMESLRGQWGQADVEDAVSGLEYASSRGLCDPNRVVVWGGSSGGYTVLQIAIHQPNRFKAGIAVYPVCDHLATTATTHKFERCYNDFLLGTLPESRQLYVDRSPVTLAHKITMPIALFHGADDPVVTVEQSRSVAAALRSAGVPHLYQEYEGEGHGFRKLATKVDYYTKVEAFLAQHLHMI